MILLCLVIQLVILLVNCKLDFSAPGNTHVEKLMDPSVGSPKAENSKPAMHLIDWEGLFPDLFKKDIKSKDLQDSLLPPAAPGSAPSTAPGEELLHHGVPHSGRFSSPAEEHLHRGLSRDGPLRAPGEEHLHHRGAHVIPLSAPGEEPYHPDVQENVPLSAPGEESLHHGGLNGAPSKENSHHDILHGGQNNAPGIGNKGDTDGVSGNTRIKLIHARIGMPVHMSPLDVLNRIQSKDDGIKFIYSIKPNPMAKFEEETNEFYKVGSEMENPVVRIFYSKTVNGEPSSEGEIVTKNSQGGMWLDIQHDFSNSQSRVDCSRVRAELEFLNLYSQLFSDRWTPDLENLRSELNKLSCKCGMSPEAMLILATIILLGICVVICLIRAIHKILKINHQVPSSKHAYVQIAVSDDESCEKR